MASSPKNFTKRHPDTSYDSKYPYNRVMVTESGHELHWDDTKGKERVRFAHRTGTYFEMSPDGRRVDMTTGHHVVYAKGGMTTTSDRNVDLKVHGSDRESIGGHKHQEVKGTYGSSVGIDRKQVTGGDYVTSTGGDSVHAVVGDYLEQVGGLYRQKVDGGAQIRVTGNASDETSETKLIAANLIVLRAPTIVLDSPDIRLGGFGASRELALRGSTDTDGEADGPDSVVGNLATRVRGI
jgi:hypothetical protein